MLVAARAMNATVAVLKPRLVEHEVRSSGTVAIGTVEGDLHDIGKNLVAMMLEGNGYEVVDLGTDVPPERFVDAIRAGADVVAMSALLTTTMTSMKDVVDGDQRGRPAGQGPDYRRRRADHGQVRGRDRGRRIRARCLEGGAQGARAADCVVSRQRRGRADGTVRQAPHLAQSDDLVFGRCPRPLPVGGLVIGGGTVYPELNFTLPTMAINKATMPEVRDEYRQMADEALRAGCRPPGSRTGPRTRAAARVDPRTRVGRGDHGDPPGAS